MAIFALESLLGAIGNDALVPEKAAFWQTLALVAKSFFPGVWLLFSVTYSRANYRDFVVRSQWLLLGAFSIPLLSLAVFYGPLLYPVTYEPPGYRWGLRLSDAAKILNVLILVSTILILTNTERTFRAAVGTMRWRIKFLVLGLGIVFGALILLTVVVLLIAAHGSRVGGTPPTFGTAAGSASRHVLVARLAPWHLPAPVSANRTST